MSKFFIPILLDSIQKNPNAGSTVTVMSARKTGAFHFENVMDEIPEILNDENVCAIMSDTTVQDGEVFKRRILDGMILDFSEETLNKLAKAGVHVAVEQHLQKFYHEPELEWLFSLDKTVQVQCENCKEKFLWIELTADEAQDGSYSSSICPRCGHWKCCELEFEKIEVALERKNHAS